MYVSMGLPSELDAEQADAEGGPAGSVRAVARDESVGDGIAGKGFPDVGLRRPGMGMGVVCEVGLTVAGDAGATSRGRDGLLRLTTTKPLLPEGRRLEGRSFTARGTIVYDSISAASRASSPPPTVEVSS